MRRLFKEKNIAASLFLITLIVFFFAQQDTKKFDGQSLNSNASSLQAAPAPSIVELAKDSLQGL